MKLIISMPDLLYFDAPSTSDLTQECTVADVDQRVSLVTVGEFLRLAFLACHIVRQLLMEICPFSLATRVSNQHPVLTRLNLLKRLGAPLVIFL